MPSPSLLLPFLLACSSGPEPEAPAASEPPSDATSEAEAPDPVAPEASAPADGDPESEATTEKPPATFAPPERWTFEGVDAGDESTAFYPVGWSPEGAFAFVLYKDSSEGCGDCTFFDLVVQDLVTDKVVEKLEWNRPGAQVPLEDLWASHLPEITEKLTEAGIEPPSDFAFQRPPVTHGDHRIHFDVQTQEVDEDEGGGFYRFRSAELRARQEGGGTKTIWKDEELQAMGLEVAGVFTSPHEPRGAVVLSVLYRGFEGAGSAGTFRVVGCHLEAGFE